MKTILSKEVTEQSVEKAVKEFKPTLTPQVNAIIPNSFQQVLEMAQAFSKSGLVPSAMAGKPEACAIAILHGLELGVTPSQAVSNIMVINGRPTVWGDLMLALALGSGELESFDEDDPEKALKQQFGRCVCKRTGSFNPVTRTFSMDDAKRAGLKDKQGPWQQYTGRMLQMRARSWALRDCIPHVLKGLVMREEVEDYQQVKEPTPMPERVKPTPPETQEAQIIKPAEPEPTVEPVQADVMVDDKDRKELFKLRSEAGISVADTKAYLKATFGVEDTGRLTKKQAEELQVWFVKNARK